MVLITSPIGWGSWWSGGVDVWIYTLPADLPVSAKNWQYAIVTSTNTYYQYNWAAWINTGIKVSEVVVSNLKYIDKWCFATLLELQTAYPTGSIGDHANVANMLYRWNGSAWASTGVYVNSIMDFDGNPINPATTEDIMRLMRYVSALAIKDSSGRLRVTVDNVIWWALTVSIASAQTLATVTSVWTVWTITNIPTIGWMWAELLMRSVLRTAYNTWPRSRLSYT